MANLLRVIFAIFWLAVSGFLGFLAYVVIRTETNPHTIWAWLVMCALAFVSVSFLAYTIIYGHGERSEVDNPTDRGKA